MYLRLSDDMPAVANRLAAPPIALSAALLNRSGNSKLLHAELEGRAIQAQTYSRTVWPRQHPLGLLQGRQDLCSFYFLESVVFSVIIAGYSSVTKILKLDSQNRPRRKNYRAFDHILQLAYVPGPAIADEALHRLRRDGINRSVHPSREVLDEMPHKQRNVLWTFTQRRNLKRKNIESVK